MLNKPDLTVHIISITNYASSSSPPACVSATHHMQSSLYSYKPYHMSNLRSAECCEKGAIEMVSIFERYKLPMPFCGHVDVMKF